MAEQPGTRKGRTAQRARAPRARGKSTELPPASVEGDDEACKALAEARARIAALEADLATARRTIRALVAESEGGRGHAPANSVSGGADGAQVELPAALAERLDEVFLQRAAALADAEEELARKNCELARINEMKVEFISIATHELRTPLTSIVGYLDLMAEGSFGDMPQAMERPMASLRRNAHRLKRVVDEMLDVSRIDAGRVMLFRTVCDIGGIVKEVVAELEPQATTKRLALSATVDTPPPIYADLKRIRQAAFKLIANAIRNAPEGGAVTATVDTAPHRIAGSWARLRVKGTGISIPIHLRNHIFEPFAAVHTAKHHTSSGPDPAGLGLYIARGLIDLHGGVISVDFQEGAYTEFTVLLPCADSSIMPG